MITNFQRYTEGILTFIVIQLCIWSLCFGSIQLKQNSKVTKYNIRECGVSSMNECGGYYIENNQIKKFTSFSCNTFYDLDSNVPEYVEISWIECVTHLHKDRL